MYGRRSHEQELFLCENCQHREYAEGRKVKAENTSVKREASSLLQRQKSNFALFPRCVFQFLKGPSTKDTSKKPSTIQHCSNACSFSCSSHAKNSLKKEIAYLVCMLLTVRSSCKLCFGNCIMSFSNCANVFSVCPHSHI